MFQLSLPRSGTNMTSCMFFFTYLLLPGLTDHYDDLDEIVRESVFSQFVFDVFVEK